MLCMFVFCYVSIFLLPQNPYSAASKAMPPAELFLPFLQRVFQRIEASGRGWLLEKGPRCVEHFEPWRAAGIFPEKVPRGFPARLTARALVVGAGHAVEGVRFRSTSTKPSQNPVRTLGIYKSLLIW